MVWGQLLWGCPDRRVPWGGYKMSGHGRESGRQHVEEFLKRQSGNASDIG